MKIFNVTPEVWDKYTERRAYYPTAQAGYSKGKYTLKDFEGFTTEDTIKLYRVWNRVFQEKPPTQKYFIAQTSEGWLVGRATSWGYLIWLLPLESIDIDSLKYELTLKVLKKKVDLPPSDIELRDCAPGILSWVKHNLALSLIMLFFITLVLVILLSP